MFSKGGGKKESIKGRKGGKKKGRKEEKKRQNLPLF